MDEVRDRLNITGTSRDVRRKQSEELIKKLFLINSQLSVPSERIALDCMVKNNTVLRWLRNWQNGQVQVMQPAQMYVVRKFVERYEPELKDV